ncbi:hypothetical protein JCM5296_000354 [Sporobolomyces johnsonii]
MATPRSLHPPTSPYGQHAVLEHLTGDRRTTELVQNMWDGEKKHIAAFDKLITQHEARRRSCALSLSLLLAHLDTAIENEPQQAPAYALLSAVIAGGCRWAIGATSRI